MSEKLSYGLYNPDQEKKTGFFEGVKLRFQEETSYDSDTLDKAEINALIQRCEDELVSLEEQQMVNPKLILAIVAFKDELKQRLQAVAEGAGVEDVETLTEQAKQDYEKLLSFHGHTISDRNVYREVEAIAERLYGAQQQIPHDAQLAAGLPRI